MNYITKNKEQIFFEYEQIDTYVTRLYDFVKPWSVSKQFKLFRALSYFVAMTTITFK